MVGKGDRLFLETSRNLAIAFRHPDTTRKVFDVMPPVQPSPQKRDRTGY
ncbi:MAG: hypothetical protein P5690_17520 [Limnospira sp. PMC 1236.20]|nr:MULTISPECIES: hypothetical protein [unclassified Limnospira]MDT9261142.1 hypothetical protein [Limnospira sp. PMC 1236.20]